jgi:hypothetical protein
MSWYMHVGYPKIFSIWAHRNSQKTGVHARWNKILSIDDVLFESHRLEMPLDGKVQGYSREDEGPATQWSNNRSFMHYAPRIISLGRRYSPAKKSDEYEAPYRVWRYVRGIIFRQLCSLLVAYSMHVAMMLKSSPERHNSKLTDEHFEMHCCRQETWMQEFSSTALIAWNMFPTLHLATHNGMKDENREAKTATAFFVRAALAVTGKLFWPLLRTAWARLSCVRGDGQIWA